MKSSFVLIVSIILVVLISFSTIFLTQTKTVNHNLNKLKYLHLQAKVHMHYIKNKLLASLETEIENISLDDQRYNMQIVNDEDNKSIYYITVETVDDTPVRLSEKVIKY
ncbi:MAG: hypothetical protein U9Q04_09985 [Campylobacterota bacterium]|nr:hypothetical protein [Campylobacterota bacterium]